MSTHLSEKVQRKVKDTEFEEFFRETFIKGRNARDVMKELALPADYEIKFLRFMRTATTG